MDSKQTDKDVAKIIQFIPSKDGKEFALLSDGRVLERTRLYKGDEDNWTEITGKMPDVKR